MGTCVSRPEGCVRGPRRSLDSARKQRRKRRIGPRGSSRKAAMETINEGGGSTPAIAGDHRSGTNPASLGGIEEAWFDAIAVMESDCDDDYQSTKDDSIYSNGLEGVSASTLASFKDANQDEGNINTPSSSIDRRQKGVETAMPFVSHDDLSLSCSDKAYVREEDATLENCGILANNCLPCLAPIALTPEKRRSLSLSPPNSTKKAALKLSFKKKPSEGHPIPALFSTKAYLERPLAGSQVPFCPLEKKMLDCWSRIESSTFRVRGENYFRDKKKVFAPNYAAYYPFGVDVYLSQQKIDHIGRFVELPSVNSSGKFPPLLIVNVQIPTYPAAIFQNETDGEGINFVLYFRLSESYSKELPISFQENIEKLIDDQVERVKGFPMDTIVPFRERLKVLGRVANLEDLPLNAAESKLMHAYNEKPVLSRPQHEFYLGENYFEIDLDMHRFSYISRKGFETFLDRLKLCVLDIGLTIQGNKPEELPEQILCCIRLSGIDYANYHQLAVHSLNQEPWSN